MDLLVENPFWPALLAALCAILLMRLALRQISPFVPAPADADVKAS